MVRIVQILIAVIAIVIIIYAISYFYSKNKATLAGWTGPTVASVNP